MIEGYSLLKSDIYIYKVGFNFYLKLSDLLSSHTLTKYLSTQKSLFFESVSSINVSRINRTAFGITKY